MKFKIVTLLMITMLLTGCGANTEAAEQELMQTVETEEETTEEATQEEPYVVSFEANTIEGEAMSSEIFANSRVTMINVWATYCNPCLSEMPDLGEIATAYDAEEFQMIGIISDVAEGASEDDIANAKELIEQTEAGSYSHLLLNESLYTNLVGGVNSVPTTFFVNQKGEMLGYAMGAQSKETWESIINDLLSSCE